MNAVSGNADDSLDYVEPRFRRRQKHDDITMAYLSIREDWTEPPRSRCELLTVHKHVISDEQSVFHRARRNLKCLHDESNNEQAGYQHCRQRREKLYRSFARLFRLRIFFI